MDSIGMFVKNLPLHAVIDTERTALDFVRDTSAAMHRAQENSAYPSGLCAERVALFAAHNDLRGAWITDIALVGGAGAEIDEEPVFPCGACAQVLLEFESPEHPVNILCAGSRRVLKLTGAASLLPFGFGK